MSQMRNLIVSVRGVISHENQTTEVVLVPHIYYTMDTKPVSYGYSQEVFCGFIVYFEIATVSLYLFNILQILILF